MGVRVAPARMVALVMELARAKTAEGEARKRRVEVEEAIVACCGFTKPDGQETYEASTELSTARIVIAQPILTTFNGAAWPAFRRGADERVRAVVRTEYKLRTAKARVLQKAHPDLWAGFSELVDRKPGKVSVEISALSDEDPAFQFNRGGA